VVERFAWWVTMQNKTTVLVGVLGLLLASIAFVMGINLGSAPSNVYGVENGPNEYCYPDPNPEQFTPKHVETKVVACQVAGMFENDAIALIEEAGITHRIASRDTEGYALTEDYSDSRINLDIVMGIVVGATAW